MGLDSDFYSIGKQLGLGRQFRAGVYRHEQEQQQQEERQEVRAAENAEVASKVLFGEMTEARRISDAKRRSVVC